MARQSPATDSATLDSLRACIVARSLDQLKIKCGPLTRPQERQPGLQQTPTTPADQQKTPTKASNKKLTMPNAPASTHASTPAPTTTPRHAMLSCSRQKRTAPTTTTMLASTANAAPTPIDAGVRGRESDGAEEEADETRRSSCAAVTPVMEMASEVRRYERNVRSSAAAEAFVSPSHPRKGEKAAQKPTEVVAHLGPRHLDADVPQPRARDRPPRAVRRRHGAQHRLQLRQGLRAPARPLVDGAVDGAVDVPPPRPVRGRPARGRSGLLSAAPRRELELFAPRRGGRCSVAAAAVATLEVRAVAARVRGLGSRGGHACLSRLPQWNEVGCRIGRPRPIGGNK
jgi:hypothetical protein